MSELKKLDFRDPYKFDLNKQAYIGLGVWAEVLGKINDLIDAVNAQQKALDYLDAQNSDLAERVKKLEEAE